MYNTDTDHQRVIACLEMVALCMHVDARLNHQDYSLYAMLQDSHASL